MQKYRVKSISEYISILENKGIYDYVYRGQNEPYFSIEASGFRPYKGGWDSDKIYDMEYIQSEFYNRISYQVSEEEKKFFLAFCQHHGIPTNLVDMSVSPLVALFFACDGKTEQKFSLHELIHHSTLKELETNKSIQSMLISNIINQTKKPFFSLYGQVYLIKKKRLIDITDIIIQLKGRNLFEELLSNKDIILNLLNSIKKHFRTTDIGILNSWIKNLLETYYNVYSDCKIGNNSVIISKKMKNLISKTKNMSVKELQNLLKLLFKFTDNDFYKSLFKDDDFYYLTREHELISLLYISFIIEIIYLLKNSPCNLNVNLDIYFTYQSPELFGRISSQQSFFIYQPYIYTNDGVYDYCELNIQSIIPDILIEIDNYSDISRELNLIGIDSGSIYGDIDNIAKALLKFSGKLKKV